MFIPFFFCKFFDFSKSRLYKISYSQLQLLTVQKIYFCVSFHFFFSRSNDIIIFLTFLFERHSNNLHIYKTFFYFQKV